MRRVPLSSHAVAELIRLGMGTLEPARWSRARRSTWSSPRTQRRRGQAGDRRGHRRSLAGERRQRLGRRLVAGDGPGARTWSMTRWPRARFDEIYPILMDLFAEGMVATEPVVPPTEPWLGIAVAPGLLRHRSRLAASGAGWVRPRTHTSDRGIHVGRSTRFPPGSSQTVHEGPGSGRCQGWLEPRGRPTWPDPCPL
jgi:hypothetical protein